MLRRAWFCVAVMVVALVNSSAIGQGLFPLCRELAAGHGLPRTYGIGLTAYYQDQDYKLSELKATVPGMDVSALLGGADLDIANKLLETNLKLDMWVIPFVNVFLLLGYIDGETVVDVNLLPQDLEIDYDGLMYGAGATVAGGWKQFFASLTATYTETDLDVSQSRIEAWILAPKFGMETALGAFWLGAMYQRAEEKHEGSLDVNMGPGLGVLTVSYDIVLEQDEPWNYLAGCNIPIGEAWELMVEGGLGARKQLALAATYRF